MARFPGVATTGSWGCQNTPSPAASSSGRHLPPRFLLTLSLSTIPKREHLGVPSLPVLIPTVLRPESSPQFYLTFSKPTCFLCLSFPKLKNNKTPLDNLRPILSPAPDTFRPQGNPFPSYPSLSHLLLPVGPENHTLQGGFSLFLSHKHP